MVDRDPDRNLNKLILLTAINAEKEQAAVNSTYRQLLKAGKLEEYNLTTRPKIKIKEQLRLLKEKHKLISGDIADGKGSILQYFDSSIVEKLIRYFTKRGIPILSVHDSIVCPKMYANFIIDKMWQYYYEVLVKEIKFRIHYNSINPHKHMVIRNPWKRYIKPNTVSIESLAPFNKLLDIKKYEYKHIFRPLTSGTYLLDRESLKGITPRDIEVSENKYVINIKSETNSLRCSSRCSFNQRYQTYKTERATTIYTSIIFGDMISRDTER